MGEPIEITVDGRKLKTENRTMLLDILNQNDIFVPQLCNHPALIPSGSCRLCLVEITRKEWNNQSKIVTSCLYPAENGLIVSTRSAQVLRIRRNLLKLYLAQYPGSELIRNLARDQGVDSTPYTTGSDDDSCILCGLCTRVCQDLGPGAISMLERGIDKQVGPNPDGYADDCTGCRTCESICPTKAIAVQREGQYFRIWKRDFEIAICSVDPNSCRGCGLCEAVCPFSIPRVELFKDGHLTSQISPTLCIGCGICAGSCPTGAIKQHVTNRNTDFHSWLKDADLKNRIVTFACPRSPLPTVSDNLVRVSCIGSVDIATILYCIAAGAKGVVLMCRDQQSCPYCKGGELAEEKVSAARNILDLCGLPVEQAAFIDPGPGQQEPEKSLQTYADSIDNLAVVLDETYTAKGNLGTGMDLALDIIQWLRERSALEPAIPESISALLPVDPDSETALYLDCLPELSILLPLVTEDPIVMNIIRNVALLLQDQHIRVRLVNRPAELKQPNIKQVIVFDDQAATAVPDNKVHRILTAEEQHDRDEEIPDKFSFRISPEQRRALLSQFSDREDQKVCSTVAQCLQYALLLCSGTWQFARYEQPLINLSSVDVGFENNQTAQETLLRIKNHPILPQLSAPGVKFTFNDQQLIARESEVISSALYAAGITVFGHHHRDDGAQGVFCVNGQCSQCMVIANGRPVKACMTAVTENMQVYSVEGIPALEDVAPLKSTAPSSDQHSVDVLIIGGGPAGICAAIELGSVGVKVLLVDDKPELGGKLSLQTHNFFGSVSDCYAGFRGIDIGQILADQLAKLPSVDVWLNATVVGIFSDRRFGIVNNESYKLVKAERVLFATGAREKSLLFPGSDLPGVYGAGAFQTLVNRDQVSCARKLFIVGGGNVGLIGAYHALQAGIDVVGLVEALPHCGGYKVHEDKIRRLGVPIWTAHTVLRITGNQQVEKITIAAIDENFRPIPGTERVFDVDTVLIAVGLSPVNELLLKAQEYSLTVYAAGDANEIAEASAAIFSGRITGRQIALDIGIDIPIPSNWEPFGELLKHRPGEAAKFKPVPMAGPVQPIIRCVQEIPCDPCTRVCPNSCISKEESLLALPKFEGECSGCGKCVLSCPGLAITLLFNNYDPAEEKALLMVPYEFSNETIPLEDTVKTVDMRGNLVGSGKIVAYKDHPQQNKRRLLLMEVPFEDRFTAAGFRIREPEEGTLQKQSSPVEEDPIVCRCERVHKSEIVREIRAGVRDMNQLKAAVRAGLGGCNGKTCTDLILRIFQEEGVALSEVTMPTHRPLVAEVHLNSFIDRSTEEN